MRQRTSARLAALLVFGAIVAGARVTPDAQAATADPGVLIACTAKVSDSVAIAQAPVTIKASLSEAIGDSISASFPSESNVTVDKVAAEPTGDVAELTLNTAKAKAGEWTLSLKGTKAECTGKLTVTEAHP